ncbi:MAG: excinuclease ABC subunit B [Flavobacteriales bacterium]|nr:excinuclease ABC subunit B [Flavobacteriales bacterium]|tara:strand:- start:5017 stop:7026 length:2010 start_codon:yes stop_codon:yes gene_type:complete
MNFELVSDFNPTGDQPQAIQEIVDGLNRDLPYQTLQGVTGSGKTFTMANVIMEVNKPTLVLCHNKTLAAQLYGEFKEFFPKNAVEYFVSYYDYYQPEAYIPHSGIYIEKDLSINEEIEKLRLSSSSTLLSGRKDVIVISSVSCIYGIGNPAEFHKNVIELKLNQKINRQELLLSLVSSLYSRTEINLERGQFRVKGDSIDIFPAYSDFGLRIMLWDNEVESLESFDPVTGHKIDGFDDLKIYPANLFVTSKERLDGAKQEIKSDLIKQIDYFKEIGKHLEAKRLEERVNFDLEMIQELGYCSGIENYSRYLDGRDPGTRPFCLIDYFPDNFMLFVDESHVTLPQVRAMFGGDRSRKENLVDYGFRLPAAMDNRPLKFEEFKAIVPQVVFVSATPADYELEQSEGVIVEQIIRPTGLLDPIIEIRPTKNQIDDLLEEITKRVENQERILVTTLTKRMAEELTTYLTKYGVKCRYIHSDIDTIERVEIMRDLRLGIFDVLVGVNLLREGLDLPEVSLVAILDADKEGFLRSQRSLTQTVGRAARHTRGRAIFYADKTTDSMKRTIEDNERKRSIQMVYNTKNNLIPFSIKKSKKSITDRSSIIGKTTIYETNSDIKSLTFNEEEIKYMSAEEKIKKMSEFRKAMENAAKELNFIEAARFRDLISQLKNYLD